MGDADLGHLGGDESQQNQIQRGFLSRSQGSGGSASLSMGDKSSFARDGSRLNKSADTHRQGRRGYRQGLSPGHATAKSHHRGGGGVNRGDGPGGVGVVGADGVVGAGAGGDGADHGELSAADSFRGRNEEAAHNDPTRRRSNSWEPKSRRKARDMALGTTSDRSMGGGADSELIAPLGARSPGGGGLQGLQGGLALNLDGLNMDDELQFLNRGGGSGGGRTPSTGAGTGAGAGSNSTDNTPNKSQSRNLRGAAGYPGSPPSGSVGAGGAAGSPSMAGHSGYHIFAERHGRGDSAEVREMCSSV